MKGIYKFIRNKYPVILLFFAVSIILISPNVLFCLLFFLNEYSNAILAIVAILGLLFGQSWLNTSKKKMKGKLDYDIARKYLKAVLQLRNAVKIVRNPFISAGEMQNALQDSGLDVSDYHDKEKVNRSVYSVRWAKIQEAWTNLEQILLDAEVSFGQEAVNVQKKLDKLIRELRGVIWFFMNDKENFGGPSSKNFKILYGTYDDNDEFAKEIDKEIDKIKSFLKKHL